MEDFNSLLSHEQVELIRAQAARTASDRKLHRKVAETFGRQIEAHAFPYRSLNGDGTRLFDAHLYDYLVEETAH